MKRKCLCRSSFSILSLLCASVLLSSVQILGAKAEENGLIGKEVYIGGMTAGFFLSEEGVRIVGFSEITTKDGDINTFADSPFKAGDRIIEAGGYSIRTIADLGGALNKCKGKPIKIKVLRDDQTLDLCVTPIKDINGKYKLGILIRDNVSGIGTVTYIQKDNLHYGALGHEVYDENNTKLSIADSRAYSCSIVGINKGIKGKAGELKGLFINDKPFATAQTICDTGIYGTFSPEYDFSNFKIVETASVENAHIGKAVIYSTLSGVNPEEYEISIVKVDKRNKENKNYVIKVTDDNLLSKSGGIVQGMSGSPIIQDGKMVGAVTHVFLNDPTRGFGIAVENMLRE